MQILCEGRTVKHVQYGLGNVTESNHEHTSIDFDSRWSKKCVTSNWSARRVGGTTCRPANSPARAPQDRPQVKLRDPA
ncbi:MAG: hypothetical protein ACRD5K_03015 [Candidatus Acidiferrales bacterium]